MLKITDYYLLVLRGFEALRREIGEAEDFTAQQYNNQIAAERARQEQQTQPTQQEQQVQPETTHPENEEVKNEPEDINI